MISVFGASGFLGAQVCNSLNLTDTSVDAVMRESSNPWRLEGPTVSNRVFIGRKNWDRYLVEKTPKVVIAAQWEGVSKTQRGNAAIQRENVESVMELACISKRIEVSLFVAFGSQAEVASSKYSIDETLADAQGNPYANAKSELGLKLSRLFADSKTRFIWVRPFSIYGPKDSNESLIPQMVQSAQSGDTFNLKNPGLAWSALHISDFGNAMKLLVSHDGVSGVVNIGNPNPITIHEYARIAQQSIGRFFPTWKGCNADSQPPRNGKIPQVNKLRDLGWSPMLSLPDGIEDTINWLCLGTQAKAQK